VLLTGITITVLECVSYYTRLASTTMSFTKLANAVSSNNWQTRTFGISYDTVLELASCLRLGNT